MTKATASSSGKKIIQNKKGEKYLSVIHVVNEIHVCHVKGVITAVMDGYGLHVATIVIQGFGFSRLSAIYKKKYFTFIQLSDCECISVYRCHGAKFVTCYVSRIASFSLHTASTCQARPGGDFTIPQYDSHGHKKCNKTQTTSSPSVRYMADGWMSRVLFPIRAEFFSGKGPCSRRCGRTAALRLFVPPYGEDEDDYFLYFS
jgi:hypothetical protein